MFASNDFTPLKIRGNGEQRRVRHVPKCTSKRCYYLKKHGREVNATVNSSGRYSGDLKQGVLHIPSQYEFPDKKMLSKLERQLYSIIKLYKEKHK